MVTIAHQASSSVRGFSAGISSTSPLSSSSNTMYRLSCKPSVVVYIAENKTLAGKEDRTYEGEALGRKMAVVFFEDHPDHAGYVRRVNRGCLALKQDLLSIAELLQVVGGVAIPLDPDYCDQPAHVVLVGGENTKFLPRSPA